MGILFDITHTTTYRYEKPVEFGEHRVMFRPRDSHDMRVLATNLEVDPPARHIRLIQDVYSNSVAIVQPVKRGSSLTFVCTFTVEHMGSRTLDLPIEEHARTHPFTYDEEEQIALQHYLQPCYPDEQEEVRRWADRFISGSEQPDSRLVLLQMNQAIREEMRYEPRDEEGVQSPLATLQAGKGTCRDFATLMIEAVRQLGYAARFVSGYIHSPQLITSSGATHAWVQVYLPGSGWIAFDPTNNLAGGTSLIRVGVARHAGLAVPLRGVWTGAPADFIGMTVDVQVRKRDA